MQNQNEYTKPKKRKKEKKKKRTYNSKNQRANFDMLNKVL